MAQDASDGTKTNPNTGGITSWHDLPLLPSNFRSTSSGHTSAPAGIQVKIQPISEWMENYPDESGVTMMPIATLWNTFNEDCVKLQLTKLCYTGFINPKNWEACQKRENLGSPDDIMAQTLKKPFRTMRKKPSMQFGHTRSPLRRLTQKPSRGQVSKACW
jgi:hypothetical protein